MHHDYHDFHLHRLKSSKPLIETLDPKIMRKEGRETHL